QGTGLAAGDLASVNTIAIANNPASLQWQFTKNTAFSSLKDLLAAIASVQQALAEQKNADLLVYYVSARPSQQAQNSPAVCPVPAMPAAARAQAQQVASAAGGRIGAVVSMQQGGGQIGIPTAAIRTADFIQGVILDSPTSTIPLPLPSFASLLASLPTA